MARLWFPLGVYPQDYGYKYIVEEIRVLCIENDEFGCAGLSGKEEIQAKKFSLNVEIQIVFCKAKCPAEIREILH